MRKLYYITGVINKLLSNINFAFSLKNKILIEKNIIPNPYDNFLI